MLNIRVVSWSLGVFTALSFVLCVIYGLIMPPSLHMSAFLEMVLPAFKWLTLVGFCLGLIESFLWGVYAGLVFVPIYNFFLNAGLHKASVSANSQERGER